MSSLHLVDPELRPLLEVFPTVDLGRDNLAAARSFRLPPQQNMEPGVTLERRKAPGPSGAPEVELLFYRPQNSTAPLPCIYHVHGGGYVAGSAESAEAVHRNLSARLQCAILSVEYRLAPEAIFPAAIEDCYAGLAYVFQNSKALGIDINKIGVMGESAGGGLAAALALLARDRAEYQLGFQHLIYPMLDDRTCTKEAHPFAGEFIWHDANNRFGWTSLLGDEPGSSGISQYAAPARATDLKGLPPAFISTGALDIFVEEDIEYARRLVRAGVPVELHVYPGAFHAFDIMPDAQVAKLARNTSVEALRRALAR